MKNAKVSSLVAMALVMCNNPLYAQQKQLIKGKITDVRGKGIPLANLKIKGQQQGTSTNNEGEFQFYGSSNDTLVVSCMGYQSLEYIYQGQSIVEFQLKESAQDLNEVVVVGYGSIRKKDLTGSVASIKGEDLAAMPVSNPLVALGARVPELNISNNSGRPGGGVSATIRGINSINASSAPLFVVDGVIGADFQSINPNDIESIEVLKDASSTAIYGSQASNGVIIVSTKAPKVGEYLVSAQVNFGLNQFARPLNMLDANQYMDYMKRSWEYDPKRGAFPTDQLNTLYPDLFGKDNKPRYNTDWQKEASRNATPISYYFTISGGNEKAKQLLSVGIINDTGLLRETYYKKRTVRYNTDIKLREWLTIGANLSYQYNRKNQVDDYAVGSMNATRLLAGMIPILPVEYPDGSTSTMQDFGFGYNYNSNRDFLGFYKTGIYTANNPVKLLQDLKYNRTEHQFLGNANMRVKLMEGLEFKSTFGTQFFDANNQFYASKYLLDLGVDVSGRAAVDYGKTLYWQSENFLNYTKIFEVHRVNAVLGTSWTSSTGDGFGAGSTGFSVDYFQYNNLAAGAVPGTPTSYYRKELLNSYYARFNYSYDDRYLLTLTGRSDGSSKFGSGNKYAFFPSVALGWNVSEESFLKSNELLNQLKLRTSYGITGNSSISPYMSLGTLNNNTLVYLDGKRYVGATMGSIANPDLKWERTAQINAGVDMGFLNNRLTLVADVYHKKTTDLLLDNPTSFVSGYNSVTQNIGSVQNKGIEVALNGKLIQSNDFSADLGLAISANRNKILGLGDNNADILPGRVPGGLVYNVLRVGGQVGDIIGYERLGTWGTDEAAEAAKYDRKPGDIKRDDVNKDYVYDDQDVKILGNLFPKYELFINLGVRYKQFDLSATIQVRRGNKVVNASSFELEDRQYYLNSYASLLDDAWTPSHQNTMVPAIRTQQDALYSDYPSGYVDSHFVEDGSFIRGRNLNISYSFPRAILDRWKIKGLKISANTQNFFLSTKYRGYDPELSSVSAGNTFTQGVDYFSYPNARTYALGLNLTF
ncbi:SusC/RagA family TonB-linked outer membrane protein [Sphingobacterium sp. UDSM-2020]|uniref:SusC/RagA family TonB-linked outer membrane protein n=1 Tax=Sphingobacterium sp. UDSM-2020 TaxID=2795738 RepID=UPI0019386950|nr:TonB-dependent receptor [Sphingobacterium sp. UDSM-2020]QQD11948.1 TonB-dependent receptor [Sphingobacterium sp. UDSM-2020]